MPIKLALIFFLFTARIAAAQSHYVFFTMGTAQGLSSDDVWAIRQDKYGFIWIGTTNGLNRYDGHSIKQYFHSETDKHSIAGDVVYAIFRDSDGEMWFACGTRGLSRYNYLTDNFESLPAYDSARKFNKYNAPVWRVGEDDRKRIYLSSGEACYRYDKRSGKFEEITALFNNQLVGGIGAFLMDKSDKNILWIAADNGLYRYDMAVNKIRKIQYDVDKIAYGNPAVYDIAFISEDELIGSTDKAGYIVINKKTLEVRPAEDAFNPAISHRYTKTGEAITDSRGRAWFANSAYGLVEYGHPSYSLKKEANYPYPYPEQEGDGKAICEDRDGNIWYGTTTKGVVWFHPQSTFITTYQRNYADPSSLPNSRVTCFLPLSEDEMLIGTYKGVSKMNIAKKQFDNYPFANSDKEVYPAPIIHNMERTGDSIFIATANGLSLLNLATGKFGRFLFNNQDTNSLFDNNVWILRYILPHELLVICNGAGRFDLRSGHFYSKRNAGSNDSLYTFKEINCAWFDEPRKKVWIESGSAELYEYDVETRKAVRHTYTDDTTVKMVISVLRDENEKLWVGTSTGLILYDLISHQSRRIALPGHTTWVTNILASGTTLWITTARELIKMNRMNGDVTGVFDLRTVLPLCTTSPRSLLVDKKGMLWLGTTKGFCIIDTLHFKGQESAMPPRLVSFYIFDKQRSFDRPYEELRKIVLNHRENFFSFEFTSFGFQSLQSTRYAYKLSGFDKDWNYTSVNKASYTNVPPGSYTLLIRASNGTGDWQDMKQQIVIRIRPPFWLSWPFLLLCSIGLLSLIIWLWLRKRRQERRENIEKTIDYFANSVYGENSVNEICWDIARNCISQLQFEDCVVYLFDSERNRLVQKAAYGPKNPKEHEISDPIEIEPGKGIVGTVAVTGKPLLVDDTTKDERYIVDDERRFSELAVPILHDGKVIGVIDSEHREKNFFTTEHLKALSTIASICANKIAEAQAKEEAKEQELKVLGISKQLAESQLMALRAQMNPHFVFNCLNSIQECIVTQKYGEASNYLNKFSKLFRMVLNNSGKNLVTLEEEKEVLDLYLQLEHMRFEKSFSYQITIDDELETDEILIPSMLLQPYVENALWHGLMHKEGERKLAIVFSKINEDVFRCTIDDNGIGRKRSFELKEQQSKTKRHESKGLKISEDRIEVIRKQGYHATLEMIDKTDNTGKPEGTTVIIELSTFLKN